MEFNNEAHKENKKIKIYLKKKKKKISLIRAMFIIIIEKK